MSKEHAIILPALLVAGELLVHNDGEKMRGRLRRMAPVFLSLMAVAIVFLTVRTLVTGGFRAGGQNQLFSGEPFSSRAFTMLNVVVEWLRLLFWPAQLSADYSYPRTRIATAPSLGMLPGVLVIAGCGALVWQVRRTTPVVTFAALWIAITLAIPSNLLMVTGFVLAERTLFLASAGVVLVVAVAIVHAWRLASGSEPLVRRGLIGLVGLLLVCGLARSGMRNPVWRDNQTLLTQTVQDVPISSRAHWMLAEHLGKSGRPGPAAQEMMLAVRLGQKDDFFLLGFAADHFNLAGMCGRAMPLYGRAIALTPQNQALRANASLCLLRLGRIGEARTLVLAGLKKSQPSERLERIVAIADSLTAAQRERTRAHSR